MNKRFITPLLALLLLTGSAGRAIAADTPAAPATEQPATSERPKAKNLTKDERRKLAEAREKADADPAVKAAKEKADAAEKVFAKAKKSGDKAALDAAGKAKEETRADYAGTRRDVIAKTDPEAARLDERAYASGDRLRKAREEKHAKDKEPE